MINYLGAVLPTFYNMIIRKNILRTFLFGLSLLLSVAAWISCERVDTDAEDPGIALQHGEVDHLKGSQFVTVTASGEWTITLSFGGDEDDWAEVDAVSGYGNRNNILLRYSENGSESDRSVTLVLTASGKDATCTLVQKGVAGSTGGDDPGPGGDDVPQAVPLWLELPEVSTDEGMRFVMHDMTVGGIPTRNYSLLWDDDALVARWVAYPLSRWSIGTEDVGRTDDWQYDPDVPREFQPCLYKGFPSGGSYGYDRGHQIPSADRQNRNSNRQTFYFTNMTPQRSGFNQKIWANLEGHVRRIADGVDTLYVVTGCVVSGRTEIAYDNEGKEVTVPSAYFKALLKYQKTGATSGVGGYSAAAFYLEHRNFSQDSPDASMLISIDELEEKTGIDFYVNLSSVLGASNAARVEAEQPEPRIWL